MRKSRFTEHQIIALLNEVEKGRAVKDVCREHSVSEATYYQWKSKYGGMQATDTKRVRSLEDENRRLISCRLAELRHQSHLPKIKRRS